MREQAEECNVCQICGRAFEKSSLFPASSVRQAVVELIQEEFPQWSSEGCICHADLARFRGRRVERLLSSERGELTTLENDVVNSMREHELLASNTEQRFERGLTFGQRMADRVATFGGSWSFILLFSAFLVIWIIINSLVLLSSGFDPYPFILLNLILSCIAAMQAPVIMMSQNRQDAKDRLRAQHEYQINLKAELEIRHLHEKMDHLLSRQWERMIEIQQLQLELLADIEGRDHRG